MTYFGGSTRLVGGRAVIEVPEAFRLVTEPEGLNVQITPIGVPAIAYIESKNLERIVVRGNPDVQFDYMVYGRRAGHDGFRAIRDSEVFVLSTRDH